MSTKNWAIVVGINEYDNIGHLRYANRDAEAMANFFRGDGFDRVFCFADGLEILKERDQKSTQPRLTDLLSFLHDRFDLTDRAGNKLPTPLNPGDNLWFFFSGHGKRIGDRDCLLPQDYNPRLSNYETWITVDFVREALLRSGADNVILLLDACRTEGEKDDGTGIGDKQPGTITVYSCERNKPSYEIESLQHGAFTAALLEGLTMPKSDKNCATVQRLDQHLRDRVPQLCLKHPEKPSQTPSTTVDPGQKWYFLLLPKVATAQDIAALKSEARGAELEEDWDLAEQLWIRFGAVSPGDRSAFEGFARVQRKKEGRIRIVSPSERSGAEEYVRSQQEEELKRFQKAQELRILENLGDEGWIEYSIRRERTVVKPTLPTSIGQSMTLNPKGKQSTFNPGQADCFREDLGNGITLDMVQIPDSTFKVGSFERETEEDPSKKQLYSQIAGAVDRIVSNVALVVNEIPAGVARAVHATLPKLSPLTWVRLEFSVSPRNEICCLLVDSQDSETIE